MDLTQTEWNMYPKRLALLLLAFSMLCTGVMAQYRGVMPYAKIQFFDRNGKPLASGKLYSYVAGTTTPKATYVSSTGAANTNPVILDAAGRAEIWLDLTTSYKFILKDRNDVQQWSVDQITDWGGNYASGTTTLSGDVGGAFTATVVDSIQGIAISTTDPTANQVLKYTGGAWTPGSVFDYIDFTGPTTSTKTFTLPNASDTVATFDQLNIFTAAHATTPATLTVAGDGTIATDADESNIFRVTLTTDCPCTLSTPTNPTNGQIATWEVIQATGGNETLAYSAAFAFGTVVTSPTITVTASKRDFLTAVYNSTTTKWYVLYVTQGY